MSELNYRQWIGNAAIVLAFIGSSSLVTWGLVHEYAKPQDPFKDVEKKLAQGIGEDTSMGSAQGQSRQTGRTRTPNAQQSGNPQGRTVSGGQGQRGTQVNARQGGQGGQQGGRGGNMVTARGGRGGRGGGGAGGGMDPGAVDMGAMDFPQDPGAADGG